MDNPEIKDALLAGDVFFTNNHSGNEVSFQEKEKKCNGNFASGCHLLKLTKSQLSLYNEGKSVNSNEDRLETQMDLNFSKLDTAFPSELEEWIIQNGKCEELSDFEKPENDDSLHVLGTLSGIPETADMADYGDPRIRKEWGLEAICGLTEVKSILRSLFIYRILYPHFFPGSTQGSNILLYGPPGTGKSLLAKAIAEEVNAVLHRISSADLLSRWHGETEQRIRAVFEAARSADSPVVLFFDEIDGLCRSRSSSDSDVVRRVKAELLMEFEKGKAEGRYINKMYLIGATNCPWEIDSAFLRRFHKQIYIPLPDKEARIDILKRGFEEVETDLTDLEWEFVGNLTEGYSGSDLMNAVVDSCCERLVHMMSCQYWKSNDNFWIPAAPDTLYSVRMNFEDLPNHQIQCRPINISDLRAGIAKTPKSVSGEEVVRFREYAARNK